MERVALTGFRYTLLIVFKAVIKILAVLIFSMMVTTRSQQSRRSKRMTVRSTTRMRVRPVKRVMRSKTKRVKLTSSEQNSIMEPDEPPPVFSSQLLNSFNVYVANISQELGTVARMIETVASLPVSTARLSSQFDLLAQSNINIQNRLARLEDLNIQNRLARLDDLNPPPPPGHPVPVKLEDE